MSNNTDEPNHDPRRTILIIGALLFAVMSVLIMARLGHYHLWDDEANTGIFALGVWETGDTSAVQGPNVLAYHNGVELDEELRGRIAPPLSFFLVAPFVGVLGATSLTVRLPFAIAGLATLLFMMFWLWRERATVETWALFAIAMTGNVSFILFSRQGRYFMLSTLFAVVMVFFYTEIIRRDALKWPLVAGMSVAGALLMTTHYQPYAGVLVALLVDYLIWGRSRGDGLREQIKAISAFGASQLVVGTLVVSTWYPLGKALYRTKPDNWLLDRLYILWMNVRDINSCEFGAGVLLIAAIAMMAHPKTRDPIIGRILVGLAGAILITSVFSSQPSFGTTQQLAHVRYLVFLLPPIVYISVRVLAALPTDSQALKLLVAVVAFHTTLLHMGLSMLLGGPELPFRSTSLSHVEELITPQISPYGAAVSWLEANATPGESVVTAPHYATYPLMFHAPQLVYAWQFDPEFKEDPRFKQLAPIHFKGRELPRYLVVFGKTVLKWGGTGVNPHTFIQQLGQQGVTYQHAATLDVYGRDQTRAEMVWHSFEPRLDFDRRSEAVYIFKLTGDTNRSIGRQ